MLRPGHAIALCVLTLLTIGLVMVWSAGMDSRLASPPPTETIAELLLPRLLSRDAAYMTLALAAMLAVAILPVRRLCAWLGAGPPDPTRPRRLDGIVLFLGTAALLGILALSYAPGIGREINGSYRWVRFNIPGLGEQSAQPSELVKWGVVALLAWFGARRAAAMARFGDGLLPSLAALGVLAAAVALEDLGTGVLIAAAGATVILAAGARLWPFIVLTPVAACLLAAFVLMSPYRIERVMAFVDPWRDPQGAGYHMIQSMMAVAGGEGFGRGLGAGIQKFGYLPEDRTDFLFAVICEELGIAGATIVICLYLGILWAGLGIVKREPAPMLRLAGLGVLATIGMQAVMNVAVVTGAAPTKGIALPLVSAGGTGWILTSAMLGLLVAMDRAQARTEATDSGMSMESKATASLRAEWEWNEGADDAVERAMIRA